MSKNYLKFTSLLLSLALTNCEQLPQPTFKDLYDYKDIKEFAITYPQLFDFNDPYYFVYIYSLDCLHCELIKNKVITYAKSDLVPMKFIEYYKDIPLLTSTALTIGATDYQDVGILGTPTLILIEEKKVAVNVSGMDYVENILTEYN